MRTCYSTRTKLIEFEREKSASLDDLGVYRDGVLGLQASGAVELQEKCDFRHKYRDYFVNVSRPS